MNNGQTLEEERLRREREDRIRREAAESAAANAGRSKDSFEIANKLYHRGNFFLKNEKNLPAATTEERKNNLAEAYSSFKTAKDLFKLFHPHASDEQKKLIDKKMEKLDDKITQCRTSNP